MSKNYLESAIKQLEYYKSVGEKAIAQVPDEALFWQYNEESNSMATIVKHLWGNMLSRWTDFLTTDGEKEWRKRDEEFENDWKTRNDVMDKWSEGWSRTLTAIKGLNEEELSTVIYIRNQGHTVMEAINRQLAHYPYHVGQLVYIAKMAAAEWESLSIARGASDAYNADKFAKPKTRQHFTDEH